MFKRPLAVKESGIKKFINLLGPEVEKSWVEFHESCNMTSSGFNYYKSG